MTTRKSASAAAFYRRRRCWCRSRGGGQPRAAVGQARVLLRSRETANRTSSPANLCASRVSPSLASSLCSVGVHGVQKQQRIKVCRSQATLGPAAARAERAAVRQSQEQSNRFSLLVVENLDFLFRPRQKSCKLDVSLCSCRGRPFSHEREASRVCCAACCRSIAGATTT